jgi:hypothetical protein
MEKEEAKHYVYRYTFPDGKVYIGSTKLEQKVRFSNGFGYKSIPLMYEEILKYGLDKIKYDVLIKGLSKEEAVNIEMEYVRIYDSSNPGKGYNKSNGLFPNSKKVRQFSLDGTFIREFYSSVEAFNSLNRQTGSPTKIDDVCRGERKSAYGFIWKRGENILKVEPVNENSKVKIKKVKQFSLNGDFICEFESIPDAARSLYSKNNSLSLNGLKSSIYATCNKKLTLAYGYLWVYSEEHINNNKIEPINYIYMENNKKYKVRQFSLDGTFIKEWESMTSAAKFLSPNKNQIKNYRARISSVCKGKSKTAHGFIWEYTNSSDKPPEKVV